jgi:hypothetical protein
MRDSSSRNDFQKMQEPEGGLRRQMLVGLIALIGLGPILAGYFISLWSTPTSRFFPLALACALFLYWRAWRETPRPPLPGSRWISMPSAAIALVLLAMAVFQSRLALGYYGTLLGISVFLWSVGGWVLFRQSFPGLLLALFCSRPVLHHLQRSLRGTCELTLEIGSMGMSILGVPHAVELDSLKLTSAQILYLPPWIVATMMFTGPLFAAFYSFLLRRPFFFPPAVVITTWFAIPIVNGLLLTLFGAISYYSQKTGLPWNSPRISIAMWCGIFFFGTWLPDVWLRRRYILPWNMPEKPQRQREALMGWIRLGMTIKLIAAVLLTMGLIQAALLAKRSRAQQRTTPLSVSLLSPDTTDLEKVAPTSERRVKKTLTEESVLRFYHTHLSDEELPIVFVAACEFRIEEANLFTTHFVGMAEQRWIPNFPSMPRALEQDFRWRPIHEVRA